MVLIVGAGRICCTGCVVIRCTGALVCGIGSENPPPLCGIGKPNPPPLCGIGNANPPPLCGIGSVKPVVGLRAMDPGAAARCFAGPLIIYVLTHEVFLQPDTSTLSGEMMAVSAVDIFLQGMEAPGNPTVP